MKEDNMFRRCRGRRGILLFSILFLVTSLAAPVLEAQTAPIGPGRALELCLKLRGTLAPDGSYQPALAHARAYAEWFGALAQAYDILGEGAEDAVGFFGALVKVLGPINEGAAQLTALQESLNSISLGLTGLIKVSEFLSDKGPTTFLKNLFKGLYAQLEMMNNSHQALMNQPAVAFIQGIGVPLDQETKKYVEWASGRSNQHLSGIASTIGIGLTVIGLLCDGYDLWTNDNLRFGSRRSQINNWNAVKSAVGVAIGGLQLIGLIVGLWFVPGLQPLGAALTVVATIWWVASSIGDAIGEQRRRWRLAYRRSYEFLRDHDPAFREFEADYRANRLIQAAKSASLQLLEEKFRDLKNGDERSQALYQSLERQALLATYYDLPEFKLPAVDLKVMKEVWKKKADYESWRISEEEKGLTDQALEALLIAFNPNYLMQEALRQQAVATNLGREIDRYQLQPAHCNPDFFLIHRFRDFIKDEWNDPNFTNNRGLDRFRLEMLTFRIEQSPFNLLPLIEIPTAQWTSQTFDDAIKTDSLQVGTKELHALANVVEAIEGQYKHFHKTYSDHLRLRDGVMMSRSSFTLSGISKDLYYFDRLRELADLFARKYQENNLAPDDPPPPELRFSMREMNEIYSYFAFPGCRPAGILIRSRRPPDPLTPRKLYELMASPENKTTLQEYFTEVARFIALNGVAFVVLMDGAIHQKNMAAIMRFVAQERLKAGIQPSFRHPVFAEFIYHGTFLGVHIDFIQDYFAGHYAPIEDYRTAANKLNAKVSGCQTSVDTFFAEVRRYGERYAYLPRTLMDTIKDVRSKFEELGQTLDLEIDPDDPDDQANYFPRQGFSHPALISWIQASDSLTYLGTYHDLLDPTKDLNPELLRQVVGAPPIDFIQLSNVCE